ncbi:zinc-dependent peptidase [Halioglobus maricola]|uniref:Zinc-dependent peptidase n=1 Tax=Halioglobus maricola TaxID=2601894 RepID=A0A5P9NEP7_9GAMM|nr:M90 family metallopeptidase [Halioglobus maricola]QFU74191.1 zinc-dependent peptidase [Halioglobus maricola]
MATVIFLLIVAAGFALFLYQTFWRDKLIRRRPFSPAWRGILEKNVPVYQQLEASERVRLEQLIQLFLAEKEFYGCDGLDLTDEIRITIAGQACLLLLGRGWQIYPGLMSVLVYPTAFIAEREVRDEDGTVSYAGHQLLGESWSNGKVILSWDDVTRGGRDFHDGHNVVLHEFAHQLDGLSGATNGAPPLGGSNHDTWAQVFSDNYDDLRARSARGLPTVLDSYGSTNPAEFFAVATEAFYERPSALERVRPDLYAELQRYYRVEPKRWEREYTPPPRSNSAANWPGECD